MLEERRTSLNLGQAKILGRTENWSTWSSYVKAIRISSVKILEDCSGQKEGE